MKRNTIKKVIFLVLLVLNIFVMTISPAYASDYSLQISLPVKQEFTVENKGTESVNQTGIYELTAISENAPLPDGSKNGKYIFSIQDTEKKIVIPIKYVTAGVYNYKLQQITEDAEKYTYDRTRYTITVYIQNEKTGRLSSQIIVEDDNDKKCGEVVFSNSYKGTSVKKPSKQVFTGNTINIAFWIFLEITSLIIILLLSYKGRKQKM